MHKGGLRYEGPPASRPVIEKAEREFRARLEAAGYTVTDAGSLPRAARLDFDGEAFASKAALELATENLRPEDFEGVDPGGKTGYTTDDVRALIDSMA